MDVRRGIAWLALMALTTGCGANGATASDGAADSGAAADVTVAPPGASDAASAPPPSHDAGANDPDGAASDASAATDALAPIDAGDASPGKPLPALPLRTDSRWIVDANGKRFKLASVNWYGAEEMDHVVAGLDVADLRSIAALVRAEGYNSVRLPWSNEMVELDPLIDDARLAANPSLKGKHALQVFDAVIDALAHEGLLVILDNHASHADWCCTDTDGNGLWYENAYPEASWIADWKSMAARYLHQPAVVGADLRNELRTANGKSAAWGGLDPSLDWHAAAQRGGNAVLGVNPSLLVIVEGLSYATDLTGAYSQPVQLAVANRLVYSAHDYAWFHNGIATYDDLKTPLGNKWGYLLTQGQSYTAPVWVGEFGTCHGSATCVDDTTGGGFWFKSFRKYLSDADIDWSYWAANGTQARGTSRTVGAEESYGILKTTWDGPALKELSDALGLLQPATQGP